MPNSTNRFAKPTPRKSRASKRRLGDSRSYETLEPRQMLATITVNTLSNVADGSSDGLISLGEAIIATNTNAAYGDAPAGDVAGDHIRFDSSLTDGTIHLQGSELAITDDLRIHGGETNISIAGDGQGRIFSINTNEDVLLARVTLTGGAELEGGAVFVQGGGKLRLYFANFSNNRAFGVQSGGGAIFNVDSEILTSNVSFTNNIANGSGGAIFSAAGNVNLFASTLTGNQANRGGGALVAIEGTYYFNDTVFNNNVVAEVPDGNFDDLTFGATVARATMFQVGGAVAFAGTDATSVVLAATFDGNYAEREGGAIWVAEGNRLFLFNNTVVSNNIARGDHFGNIGGGGISSHGGRINISTSVITGNAARGGSGGGLSSSGGHLQIYNTRVFNNSAARHGGGISATGTFIYANTLTLESNRAGLVDGFDDIPGQSPSGGGLYMGSAPASTALMFNSFIKSNVASQNGGGIYNAGRRLLIASGSFLGNNQANVSDDSISVGRSDQGGGAIYSASDSLEIYTSTIQNNRALTEFGTGGGIFSSAGSVSIGAVNFLHNRAEGNGGGLALYGANAHVSHSDFKFNHAGTPNPQHSLAGGSGGGVYLSRQVNVSTSFIGGTFEGNSATYSGGGIRAEWNSNVIVRQSAYAPIVFRDNRALRQNGGGISSANSELLVRDAVFEGNTARAGGGVDVQGGNARFFDSNITNNEARIMGGGLLQLTPSQLTNTSVVDNFAPTFPNIATIIAK